MEHLMRDLKVAIRGLTRQPGFTVAALLCLAVGIGATTAVFSLVNSVLLKAVPVKEPDRVGLIWGVVQARNINNVHASGSEVRDFREQLETFEDIAVISATPITLTGVEEPVKVKTGRISANFLPLLGVNPAQGRHIRPEEDHFGNTFVVMISDRIWRTRFGADPSILGRSISLNDQPYEVIAVLEPGFDFREQGYDFFIPAGINWERLPPRGARGLRVVGRMAPGVTAEQAQAELDLLSQRWQQEYPDLYRAEDAWGLRLVPIFEELVGDFGTKAWMLLAAVGLVLLIACANVANLQLARATARGREVAVRTALGAGRRDLVRQLFTESVVLGLLGGLLGLLLAWWGIGLLVKLDPKDIPRLDELAIDGRVLLFALGASLVTSLLFGLVPALQASKPDLQSTLKEGSKSAGAGAGGKLRSALVVAEVALAVVVLFGAGLILRSFQTLMKVDPGYRTDDVMSLELFLNPSQYNTPQMQEEFATRLVAKLEEIPGVSEAAVIDRLPMGRLAGPRMRAQFAGGGVDTEQSATPADMRVVTDGYFSTMGIPVLAGREFNLQDTMGSPPVAVIDQELAERIWPGATALGRRLIIPGLPEHEIVGVVGPSKLSGLESANLNQVYVPFSQGPNIILAPVLRTTVPPNSVARAVREAVWSIDPNLPLISQRTMEEVVAASVAGRRAYAVLLALFAGIALVLVIVGVYGVMAYAVAQRVQEFGIRMALGAAPKQVLQMVLGKGLRLAAIGVGIGLALSFLAGRVLSKLLYGISSTDPLTFVAVTLLLLLLAAFAVFLPARRATRVPPSTALRYE